VVGQVENGVFVGGGGVLDAQGIVGRDGVHHAHRQRARVALFPVGAVVAELERRRGGGGNVARGPQTAVETHVAAMQRVGAVVGGQVVCVAIEREASMGDAVGVAADQGAEVGLGVAHVAGQVVIAEHDVAALAAAVGGLERDHDAAVVGDFGAQAAMVVERVQLGVAAVG